MIHHNILEMCGRICLTLDPEQIVHNCKYPANFKSESTKVSEVDIHSDCNKDHVISKEALEEYVYPEWRLELNCGRRYTPSYNIAPTDITPVLVANYHFTEGLEKDEKKLPIIVPMMWGMIPVWHKGDYRKHGLTTHNCRVENLMQSKLFLPPLQRGQRCVVLCEGFYEWQTTKSLKTVDRAVYFLYAKQESNILVHDNTTSNKENINLLKLAGLFDVWVDDNGDKIYSYSVVTVESSSTMSWLHHRMPAILETKESVDAWLDYRNIPINRAMSLLRSPENLLWHRVSSVVNNARNKSDKCNKPFQVSPTREQSLTKQKSILNWLGVQKRPRNESNTSKGTDQLISESSTLVENSPKRQKLVK